ncbi:phosphate acyltransferase PlsX [Candidatus Dependentiae bacterium]|nr:phosphate acyltransferase PlsX [Candidatus Dependentiae bacterium]
MIALDAMGGDFAPHAIVLGGLLAARKGIKIGLYGDQDRILESLDKQDSDWKKLPISIIHCSQTIEMEDEPSSAILRKKDASLVVALNDVAKGEAYAFVSAGNTGACLVGGMLLIGKTEGILRPAIGEFIPALHGSVFFIDLGANVDCKPDHLKQFAIMGDVYVKLKKNITSPRIALLSNGAERTKGNKAVLEAHELLASSGLNFIGNREPHDILHGEVDVVVCDGFAGNIMLKSLEGMLSLIPKVVDRECRKTWIGRCLGFLGGRLLKRLKRNVARVQKGGALLLGVRKPIIIAHGASQASAIEDALLYAHTIHQTRFVDRFNESVESMLNNSSMLQKPLNASSISER